MSYPPAVHLLRDLALSGTRRPDAVTNRVPVTPGLCAGAGVRLGVIATLVDVTGAAIGLSSVAPDWVATSDLSTHLVRPITEGTVEAICRPLRVGVGRVVVEATVHDGDGVLCGSGRLAFSRIPGSATAATIDQAVGSEPVVVTIDGGTPLTESIVDRCGMHPVGPGQLRFEKSDYVRNSFGSVNGGVLALAAEAAAVSACGGGTAVDLHIHYLEQIGDGPVGVTAEVVRGGGDADDLCVVRIEDRADGRLVAIADVTVATEAD